MNYNFVTGACGFIGSHLCEALLNRGDQVYAVDCLTNLYSPAQKQKNLDLLRKHKNAEAFHFNAEDLLTFDFEPFLEKSTYVYHLAGEPGVRQSWGKQFSQYVERNIIITQRLLESLKGKKLKKLIFASSSSVYGNLNENIFSENMPCRPYSPYGVTKLAAENLCCLYADNFGIPTVALRFFTVFGPRQRPDMAFFRFISSILKNEPVTIYGDGLQSRDFTYVSDAVAGLLAAAEKETRHAIYNIGGGCPATIAEVIEYLRMIHSHSAIVVRNKEEIKGDVRHTRGDISRAREDLDYRPQVNLQEGLKRQYDWLKNDLENPP